MLNYDVSKKRKSSCTNRSDLHYKRRVLLWLLPDLAGDCYNSMLVSSLNDFFPQHSPRVFLVFVNYKRIFGKDMTIYLETNKVKHKLKS